MHSRCIHSLTFRAIPTSNTCLRTSYAQNVNIFLRAYHADFTPVKPLRLPAGHHSLLPLVNSCNNLILSQSPSPTHAESPPTIANRTTEGAVVNEEVVVPFLLSQGDLESPVGFLRSQVASAIEDDHQRHLVSHSASPWELRYSKHLPKGLKSVAFAEWVNEGGKYTRTMHMERIVLDWRKHGLFPEVLKGVCASRPIIFNKRIKLLQAGVTKHIQCIPTPRNLQTNHSLSLLNVQHFRYLVSSTMVRYLQVGNVCWRHYSLSLNGAWFCSLRS